MILHTSQNSFNKWTKISSLEITIFDLKMMVKSGLEFFILKFTKPLQRYLLICQANSVFLGRFFLHWAAATLKRLGEFQNKRILDQKSEMSISRLEILVHLLKEFQLVWLHTYILSLLENEIMYVSKVWIFNKVHCPCIAYHNSTRIRCPIKCIHTCL